MQFFLFLALILAFILVLLAVQNAEVVELSFVTWEFEGSIAFILALTFTIGMLAGIFFFIPTWWRKTKQNRVQKKRIHELEKELLSATEQRNAHELDEIEE